MSWEGVGSAEPVIIGGVEDKVMSRRWKFLRWPREKPGRGDNFGRWSFDAIYVDDGVIWFALAVMIGLVVGWVLRSATASRQVAVARGAERTGIRN